MIVILYSLTTLYDMLLEEENLCRELVEGWGYQFESHEVITEDGYILNVHR